MIELPFRSRFTERRSIASPRTTRRRGGATDALRVAAWSSILVALASCSATPQESLHGRWYNESMSIRFRVDGTVIFNSRSAGLRSGRYFFDGEIRPVADDELVTNLTLDLVDGDQVVRREFEVQLLGRERLRMTPVDDSRSGRPSDRLRSVVVLKKSTDDPNAPLTVGR